MKITQVGKACPASTVRALHNAAALHIFRPSFTMAGNMAAGYTVLHIFSVFLAFNKIKIESKRTYKTGSCRDK